MRYAVLDVESTIYQQGHPFSARNKLCLVGLRVLSTNHIFDIEYSGFPYGDTLQSIQRLLDSCDLVVGFNLKFDLNWLARYGIFLPNSCRVFDCQLVEFILANQSTPFPSLDDCLAKYNLGSKLNIVARDYWDRGLDTTEVPSEILVPYLEQDLELTDALYLRYMQLLDQVGTNNVSQLIKLHNQDLRVLQEMEFNGIRIDWNAMEQKANETEKELNEITEQILTFVPESARDLFNVGSNDHISALLYGGSIPFKRATEYLHTYKTGIRAGESHSRIRWEEITVEFPRLVEPLPKTELKKPGFYGTGADILKELPKPKRLLRLLLKKSELEKLLSTYLRGLSKKYEEMDWNDGCIHSILNQSTVVTGRLSSAKPNQQNMPEAVHEFIMSRY